LWEADEVEEGVEESVRGRKEEGDGAASEGGNKAVEWSSGSDRG
jgi:hypothetical protein